MKETNSLEEQLSSWKPRRPSAGIKQRLFPARRVRVEAVRLFNWLAPATVCVLLAVAAARQENNFPGGGSHHDLFVTMMLSNQNTVAYLADGPSQVAQNVLSSTFEFTNHNGSAFNNGFTPSTKPNQE